MKAILSGLATATILCACVASLFPQPASGQEPHWCSDYNAARKEASVTNRPIIMDFGTEHCFWCKKLDASTFRDPTVLKIMSDRFVAIKIDAEKHAPLAQALGIQSYPTLVFAAPDGKILGSQEGFVNAGRLTQKLQQALSSVRTHLQSQPSAGDPEVDASARSIAGQSQSTGSLTTPTGPAATSSAERSHRARALLEQATEDYRGQQYACSLVRCQAIASGYADLPEAAEARQLADRIKNDPEQKRQAYSNLLESVGEMYWEQAEKWIQEGKPQQAIPYLESVLKVCSGTRLSQNAQDHLTQISNQIARDPNLLKPIFRGQSH